jgi:hypothetical protein
MVGTDSSSSYTCGMLTVSTHTPLCTSSSGVMTHFVFLAHMGPAGLWYASRRLLPAAACPRTASSAAQAPPPPACLSSMTGAPAARVMHVQPLWMLADSCTEPYTYTYMRVLAVQAKCHRAWAACKPWPLNGSAHLLAAASPCLPMPCTGECAHLIPTCCTTTVAMSTITQPGVLVLLLLPLSPPGLVRWLLLWQMCPSWSRRSPRSCCSATPASSAAAGCWC